MDVYIEVLANLMFATRSNSDPHRSRKDWDKCPMRALYTDIRTMLLSLSQRTDKFTVEGFHRKIFEVFLECRGTAMGEKPIVWLSLLRSQSGFEGFGRALTVGLPPDRTPTVSDGIRRNAGDLAMISENDPSMAEKCNDLHLFLARNEAVLKDVHDTRKEWLINFCCSDSQFNISSPLLLRTVFLYISQMIFREGKKWDAVVFQKKQFDKILHMEIVPNTKLSLRLFFDTYEKGITAVKNVVERYLLRLHLPFDLRVYKRDLTSDQHYNIMWGAFEDMGLHNLTQQTTPLSESRSIFTQDPTRRRLLDDLIRERQQYLLEGATYAGDDPLMKNVIDVARISSVLTKRFMELIVTLRMRDVYLRVAEKTGASLTVRREATERRRQMHLMWSYRLTMQESPVKKKRRRGR